MSHYILRGSDSTPVLVWANMSKSSWAGGGLQLGRELKVPLTLSAPTSVEKTQQWDVKAVTEGQKMAKKYKYKVQKQQRKRFYFSCSL